MTKQTWTAAVSAVLFVVLAAVIALVPVPYVTWSPGGTYDLLGQSQGKDVVTINGDRVTTYPTTGQLRMTTVSVTSPESSLSLPEVLFSYWLPSRLVLPRAAVYRSGVGSTELSDQETQLMNDSQTTAIVAALQAAGVEVTKMPMVTSVSNSGPASGVLQPGDLIKAVDGIPTKTVQEVQDAVGNRHIGEAVVFTVLRNEITVRPTVITRATSNNPDKPIVGISLAIGYSYGPTVGFSVDPAIGGSSAGLMFALSIYDRLSADSVAAGRVVAGSGTMDADGRVGAIGGVQEKIAAASRDQATIFLLPKLNCVDVDQVPAGMRVVPVETMHEAIDVLARLADAKTAAAVPACS